MRRLRAVVVGTGFIGPVHVEALRRIAVDVVGLVGSSSERAEGKAEALGVERVYTDFEEAVADTTIDVIHITSPNHLHHAHASAALRAGRHVVCEKPLAMNSAETAELVRLADETGLVAAVNFNVRYYPLVHEARARVQSGSVGALTAVHGSYLQDWLLYPTDWNWRLEKQYSGPMRAVADIGSHWLDAVSFITGLQVESVLADFKTVHTTRHKPTSNIDTFAGASAKPVDTTEIPIDTEDFASILLRFEGGVRGALTVSQVSAGRKNRLEFEINGTTQSLAWDGERPNELWIGHRDRPNEQLIKDPSLLSQDASRIASYPGGHAEGFPDTFKQLYRDVYAAVLDPKSPRRYPTFADGHAEAVLAEAIFKSAHEDRWVRIDEIEELA